MDGPQLASLVDAHRDLAGDIDAGLDVGCVHLDDRWTRIAGLGSLRRRRAAGDTARLVGHGNTKVTETVYRKQLRPILTGGAHVMDTMFELPADEEQAER